MSENNDVRHEVPVSVAMTNEPAEDGALPDAIEPQDQPAAGGRDEGRPAQGPGAPDSH